MKTININNRNFQYEIIHDVHHGQHYVSTLFFEGFKEIKRKKYSFFGAVETKTIPNFVFRLPYAINEVDINRPGVKNNLSSYVQWLDSKK